MLIVKIDSMFLFLLFGLVLVTVAWAAWSGQNQRWAPSKWRSIAATTSLTAVTASLVISVWMFACHRDEELFYGTLMRMQPWPRIAAYSALFSIVAAFAGKRGTRILVVASALLIEFAMFGAVLTD